MEKAEELEAVSIKEEADDLLRSGNAGRARTLYTEALSAGLAGSDRARALSNRSLACLRCGRYKDALRDADLALAMPCAHQGQHLRCKLLYRRCFALQSLDHSMQSAESASLSAPCSDPSCTSVLRRCIDSAVRNASPSDVALWLASKVSLSLCSTDRSSDGGAEARLFQQHLREADQHGTLAKARSKEWLLRHNDCIPSTGVAFALRAQAAASSGEYAMAERDALAATQILKAMDDQYCADNKLQLYNASTAINPLAFAWYVRGIALRGAGRNYDALKDFVRAVDVQSDCSELNNAVDQAFDAIGNSVWASKAMSEVRNSTSVVQEGISTLLTAESEAMAIAVVSAFLQETPLRSIGKQMRIKVKQTVAEAFNLSLGAVHLEAVRAVSATDVNIELSIKLKLDDDTDDSLLTLKQTLDDAVKSAPLQLEVQSVHRAAVTNEEDHERHCVEPILHKESNELQLMQRNKSVQHSIVRKDGSHIPSSGENAFGLRRVAYEPHEKPEEAWVQVQEEGDTVCRWRQSAAEVIIQVLVGRKCSVENIAVELDSRAMTVNIHTPVEVQIRGQLEALISPSASTWYLDEGTLWLHLAKAQTSVRFSHTYFPK